MSSLVSSLFKVLCLLLVMLCLQISFTSPNPRANVQNGAVIKCRWERILRVLSASVCLWKRTLWIAALAEIAVITARGFPSLPFSNLILSTLLFGEDNDQICLTQATAIAVPLAMIGATIRMMCYRELGKYFTYELSIQHDHSLITTGPYSVVRHPSYTGIVINVSVVYLLHGTKGSWVRESGLMNSVLGKMVVYLFAAYTMTFFVGLMRRTGEEDRELRLKFGKQWDDWAARVPYSLVPGII